MNFYASTTGNVNITGTTIDVISGNNFYKIINGGATLSFTNLASVSGTKTISVYISGDYTALATASVVTFSGVTGPLATNMSVTPELVKKFVFSVTSSGVTIVSVSEVPQGSKTLCGSAVTVGGMVYAIEKINNDIYACGSFTSVYTNKRPQNYASAIDTSTGLIKTQYADIISKFGGGAVNSMVKSGNYLYCTGAFTTFGGSSVKPIVKIDLTTGVLDSSFNSSITATTGTGTAITADSGGNIYVAGFTSISGTAINYIGKLSSAGAIQTGWLPAVFGASPTIFSMVTDATYIYVGGNFTSYNGSGGKANFIKLALSNAADSGFAAFLNGAVRKVLIDSNGNIYIGGLFTSCLSNTRQGVAKFSSIGSIDLAFDTSTGFGASPNVETIVLDGSVTGYIYVGGNFTAYKGTNRAGLAKLKVADATLDTTFAPAVGIAGHTYGVTGLAYDSSSGSLYCIGDFKSYQGNPAWYILKVSATNASRDATFSQSSGFDAGFAASIYGRGMYFDSSTGTLYVGGSLQNYFDSYTAATGIVKISQTTGLVDQTFSKNAGTGFNGIAYSIKKDSTGSNIFVGGAFGTYNGTSKSFLAKINASTGVLDATFASTAGGTVYRLALSSDGTGVFTVGAATGLRKFSTTNGTTPNGWTNVATSGNSNAGESIIVNSSGDVFIGGTFSSVGGLSRGGIAKVNGTSGAVDATFNPYVSSSSPVFFALDSNGNLYACGTVNSGIIALDGTSGAQVTAFNRGTGITGTPIALVIDSANSVYVFGAITAYNGTSRAGLVKINSDGSINTTFLPGTGVSPGAGWGFLMLDESNYKLYAGASFTSYNSGASYANLLEINYSTAAVKKMLPASISKF